MQIRTQSRIGSKGKSIVPAILVVLSFYLSEYNSFISGVTLGELALIIGAVMILSTMSFKIRIVSNRSLLAFIVFSILLSVLSIIISNTTFTIASTSNVVTRWIRYLAYVIFVILYCDNYCTDFVNCKVIIKTYRVIACIFAVYGIIQFLVYITTHYYLPVDILPFRMSRDVSVELLISDASKSIMRARSLFSEPGYFAKFLIPGVMLSLYGWNEGKISITTLVLYSVAIILSGSVQGVILLIIVYLIVVFTKKTINIKRILYLVGLTIVFIVIVLSGNRMGLNNIPIQRVLNLLNGSSMDRSTQIRVFRGFAVWNELPVEHKLFGVGLGNIANYLVQYNVFTNYDYYYRTEATLDYMNGISSILCSSGLSGLGVFGFVISHYKNALSKRGMTFIIVFVASLFGGGGVFTVLFVFYATLAFAFSGTDKTINMEKLIEN